MSYVSANNPNSYLLFSIHISHRYTRLIIYNCYKLDFFLKFESFRFMICSHLSTKSPSAHNKNPDLFPPHSISFAVLLTIFKVLLFCEKKILKFLYYYFVHSADTMKYNETWSGIKIAAKIRCDRCVTGSVYCRIIHDKIAVNITMI